MKSDILNKIIDNKNEIEIKMTIKNKNKRGH